MNGGDANGSAEYKIESNAAQQRMATCLLRRY